MQFFEASEFSSLTRDGLEVIIIIIIKYLYSANILKVQKRFTEVTLKILKTLLKKINIKIVKKLQKNP